MKRQYLYIGGALLATTALSTSAYAGTIVNKVADGATPTTIYTAGALSSQVFGGATPETTVIGGGVGWTVNFANSYTTSFDLELESSNSDFVAVDADVDPSQITATVTLEFLSASGTDYSGCTVQVLTERVLVEDCNATTAGTTIDALNFSSVSFNEANGLATAGTSIAISGIVRGAASASTFELITSRNVVTSRDSYSGSVTAGAAATINNSVTPPFSGIGTGSGDAATLSLGTVRITALGGTANDLSAITTANLVTGMEITVTHGVLTDAATSSLNLNEAGGNLSVTAASFVAGTASFNAVLGGGAGAGNLGTNSTFDIVVNFDGTTAISSWAAGSVVLAYTNGATDNVSAIANTSGTLASLTRGGFSTQINTAQSSAGTGATLYQSLVRLVNNGTVAGTVSITVRDDADGSSYGIYTTESIEANSSIQVSMPTIETALGITAAGQYQLGISGPIDGYAQHVMFNSVDNLFVDLSGFRAANP
jgi:hypothetical protein